MPRFKHILPAIILLCAPSLAAQRPEAGYDSRDRVIGRMASTAMNPVEGLWEFPASGTVIAIERESTHPGRFRIVVVESPGGALSAGTLLGHATATAKRGVYDASLQGIASDGRGKKQRKNKPARFTLTMERPDALFFKPLKEGWRVKWDWWRLFPYMFRFRVDRVKEEPEGLDGAVKLWPRDPSTPPRQPRYL